jgi:molybdopterin converting factor small subunit
MTVTVHFYSYFKDLTGCGETAETLPAGCTLEQLLARMRTRFPKLVGLEKSTLAAVGVEYQKETYVLQPGDEISLFPPVQGG